MNYPIAEHAHSINNIPGRMFTIHAPQEVRCALVHRNQTWKSEGRKVAGYGTNGTMHVEIRFDDDCQNGHQTFAITADIYTDESRRRRDIAAGGCLHEDIERIFPELAPLIKWHLMSTDGPLHYVANTVYHANNKNLVYARDSAVWPEATDEELTSDNLKEMLEARLPCLIAAFRADMERIGFIWL